MSSEEGEKGEESVGGAGAGLGRNGEGASRGRGRGGGMRGGRIERDIRDEDEYLYDENKRSEASLGLFAALEEADKKHKKEGEGEVLGWKRRRRWSNAPCVGILKEMSGLLRSMLKSTLRVE